jgi:hypothetical protein
LSFFTKLFALFCISTATIDASEYDDDTLTIFAKILPRMVLMSSQKERVKESIEICIASDRIDEDTAISLIDQIQNTYPNGIANHPFKLTNSSYLAIEKCKNSQLIFLLNSNDKNIEKTLQYAYDHTSLTMSYDPKYLDNGVETSLFFGRKVTPYLNINALRKNGIEIDNLLVRISKIYLYEDKK